MSESSLPTFQHYQHAHCESGVTTNLLRHAGINMTEPLAFGIGAGLFFGHLPFLKVSGTPATTYRIWPGAIFKRVAQRLKISIKTQKFSSPEKAEAALDAVLAQGIPVGLQTSVYFLPYLPEAFRFHFNAHNLVVYGKEGNEYLVSDPVMEHPTRIAAADLAKARFAKGTPEPRGFMYYIQEQTTTPNFEQAIRSGIKQTGFFMMTPPIAWFGYKGILLLARKLKKYPERLSPRKASLYLGNIIRMQEEIGTGGAGFRFLYAAFLQEAARILQHDEFDNFAKELTEIGDAWRNFAFNAARIVKSRSGTLVSYTQLGDQLKSIGLREKDFFAALRKLK
ncbi:MAG: BtrH N-terminal domain-containing protein [Bacteroidetes bacterium]|nr:BtrH N-terminal domain-containing protein [Bacteroidota bacterium]